MLSTRTLSVECSCTRALGEEVWGAAEKPVFSGAEVKVQYVHRDIIMLEQVPVKGNIMKSILFSCA